MPSSRFEIKYEGDDNEVVIIAVHSYIDSTTSPELSKIIDQQIAAEKYKHIVNLQDVDYISSIGWGVFISNLKELREHGGDLVLTHNRRNRHNLSLPNLVWLGHLKDAVAHRCHLRSVVGADDRGHDVATKGRARLPQ